MVEYRHPFSKQKLPTVCTRPLGKPVACSILPKEEDNIAILLYMIRNPGKEQSFPYCLVCGYRRQAHQAGFMISTQRVKVAVNKHERDIWLSVTGIKELTAIP